MIHQNKIKGDWKGADFYTHSQEANYSNGEGIAGPRLWFSTSPWKLKSPTIITLSIIRTGAERNSQNSGKKMSVRSRSSLHYNKHSWLKSFHCLEMQKCRCYPLVLPVLIPWCRTTMTVMWMPSTQVSGPYWVEVNCCLGILLMNRMQSLIKQHKTQNKTHQIFCSIKFWRTKFYISFFLRWTQKRSDIHSFYLQKL